MAIKLKKNDDSEAVVYGNENFGIPKDCSKKQRFSSLKLAFYLFAVGAICVTGYKYYSNTVDRFLPEITYDKTNEPLIYSTSTDIILKTQSGKSYDVCELPESDNLSAIPTSSGEGLFFLRFNEETQKTDLCSYTIGNSAISIIEENVSDFKVDEYGKHLLYTKGNTLYFSNMREKFRIFDDVCEYFLSENHQSIVFYTDNMSKMYYCQTSKSARPVLIDSDITKLISKKNNASAIYYLKDTELYFKDQHTEAVLIADNARDAILLGNTLYYTTFDTYEMNFSDFFEDDFKKTDEILPLPNGADYIKEVEGLSFFDEEEFLKDINEYENKLLRDNIRDYFDENVITADGYSLNVYSDGTSKLIDTNLQSPFLSYNSCKNITLYKKYDMENIEKPSIATLSSKDEALSVIEMQKMMPKDVDMFLLKEKKAPFLAFEEYPISQIEISLDAKYLYCIDDGATDTANILKRYEIGTSSLRNATTISNNVTSFAVDGSDSSAVMLFARDALSLFYEDTLVSLSENSHSEFFYVDKTLFYFDDYNKETQAGTLLSIRGGRISTIDTNVHAFKVRKYNAVSYIKNYNAEKNTGTLYIKEGKNIKRQDSNVSTIIN